MTLSTRRFPTAAAFLLAHIAAAAQSPATPKHDSQPPPSIRPALSHISAATAVITFSGETYSRQEKEYDSKTRVWTVYFDPSSAAPGSTGRGLIFNFYGWNPPSSPLAVAQAWVSQGGDLHTIFKFQAPDDVTKAPAYFIFSETMRISRGYGYANISKVTSIGAGAYAVTYNQRFPGTDPADIDRKIRAWLLTQEAKNIENAIGAVDVDPDWQTFLTQSH